MSWCLLSCAVLPEQCQLSVDDRDRLHPSTSSADASGLVPARQASKTISIFLAKADPSITWERLSSELQPVR